MTAWNPAANDLFLQVLELPTSEARQAYLDQACAANPKLRAQVEALLAASARAGSFLEKPVVDLGATVEPQPDAGAGIPAPASSELVTEGPGSRIGPYKLLQQIGEGGMGVVWMAEQQEPVRRRVALKVIKPGLDSAQVPARFEAERQALALMDHPHIAKVLDAGATPDGRPYFVMELVKGTPITKYCDEHRLTPRQRLELFVPVCQALQHAHQKGVIHRDVKPSNVLVAPYDGRPVVKVIDFGVAKAAGQKLTERTLFTEFGAVVGTLEYMSPEQAELNNQDIDTRSDIYSLGVLLYELLTGTTPLDRRRLKQGAFLEALRIIREEEPPRPSTRLNQSKGSLPSISAQRQTEPAKLARLVRGEVDWIVMKALEKDRGRRYDTANGLARDVERYLNDEAVEACPPSVGYKLRKFARKNKKAFATAAAFVVLLAVAALVSTALAVWATRAERDAVRARNEETVRRQEADEHRERAETVLAFFQEKVLGAGRLMRKDAGGLGTLGLLGVGQDVTVRQAIDVASAVIDKEPQSQPLVEASIRDVLGVIYHRLGELALAIQQHERVLALRQAQLGTEHLDTLVTMLVLAQEYLEAGKLDRAFALLHETLAWQKATLGPFHIETSRSMYLLAQAYQASGNLDQALSLAEETFAMRRARLGPAHSRTWSAMSLLARIYDAKRQHPEAIRLGQELLSLQRRRLPADDPALAGTLVLVGLCLLHARQPAEAELRLREGVAISQKKRGDLWPTFKAQSLLGESLLAQQKYAEAEEFLRQGYVGMKQHEAKIPWHRKVEMTEALEPLVQLYDAWGQKDQAEEWRKQLEEAKTAAKPPAKP